MGFLRSHLPVLLAALIGICAGGALLAAQAEGKAELRKVGWGPLTSKEAAKKVTRTSFEPRRQNDKANHTVPTKQQLATFHRKSDMPYQQYVNGQYVGTTDDIIEWAAYKWGLPEDALRAVAVNESYWEQDHVNIQDHYSYGLFQIRTPYHCCLPEIQTSTAFNADYYGGIIRAYYDGRMGWLNEPGIADENGRRYRAGDFWGSVGAWYSGRWHTPGNDDYVAHVKDWLKQKKWLDPFFDDQYLPDGRG